MSAYFSSFTYTYSLRSTAFPQKPSCRGGACGVTFALGERSLGPELNSDFLSQKCLPSSRKQCTSCIRLHPFRDSKTHWFWSSSLQVYRIYLTRRGMSTLRIFQYENSTGRTQQPGSTIHSMKSKSMGSFWP